MRDLRKLLEMRKLVPPDRTRTLILSVFEAARHLRELVAHVEERQEASTARFARELEIAIPKLQASMQEVRRRSEDVMVHRATSKHEAVVPFLEQVYEDVEHLVDTAATYARYQETLRLPVLTQEGLSELRGEVEAKLDLWRAVRDWEQTYEEWGETRFSQLDLEVVSQRVNGFVRAALEAERVLSGSPVVAMLRERVHLFKATLPVLSNLKCPVFKQRHLAALSHMLGFDVHDATRTLSSVLSRDVVRFALPVERIAGEAAGEANLEAALYSSLLNILC
ncbi:hypothetical protein EON62_06145 [archaeon]|nr:MAG: hypothetical protein EON62_06145 [archaeon]